MAKQNEATARGVAEKFSRILGPAWECDVWENDGWHVKWINGAVKLYYDHQDFKFWAMIGGVGEPGGHLDFQGGGDHYANPWDAIAKARFDAREVYREKWLPIIASCETLLPQALKGRHS